MSPVLVPPPGCCVHCHLPLVYGPEPGVGAPPDPVWLHRDESGAWGGVGARTCRSRPEGWRGDSWPSATPYEPADGEPYAPPPDTCSKCGAPADGWHRYPPLGQHKTPRSTWFRVLRCNAHRTAADHEDDRQARLAAIEEPEYVPGTLLLTHDLPGRSIVWARNGDGWSPVNTTEPPPPTPYAEIVVDYGWPTRLLPGPKDRRA